MEKIIDGNYRYIKSFHSFAPRMTELNETAVRIKEKANGLFMQYGLKSVSMDDIANQLGISKKTIYQFYSDKDALVEDVIAAVIGFNQSCCDRDRNCADNAVHEIFLAMDLVMEIFRSMNPSLLFDMQKYYPGAYHKFLKHKNDYLYGVIKSNVERGIREELYREDIKVDIVSRFRVESMLLPFDPAFHTKVKLGLALIEEELTIHFLYGLVSQKGYKMAEKYRLDREKKLKRESEHS